MPALGLLAGSALRSAGGLPTLPMVNLVSEQAITEPSGFALISRPPLQYYTASSWAVGTDAIRALYRGEGVLSGDMFAVFGTSVYSVDEAGVLGSLAGSLAPSFAGNEVGVIVTAGQDSKFWDGTTYRDIDFPDDAFVTKVLGHQGRFIFLRAGTHAYYWTEPLANMLDMSGDIVIDPLDYASAESEPDELVDGLIYRDHLILGGTNTIEMHGVTGDDNAPWQPTLGSTIRRGVFGTGAMATWDDTFAWISKERTVWRYNGSTAQRISNAGIEERLKLFDTLRLDSFFFEGREFLHVWGDDTYPDLLLDASTGEWSEWESEGGPFGGGPAASVGTDYPIFGSKAAPRPLAISTRTDFGHGNAESAVEHRFRCGKSLDGGAVPIHNVLLRCQTYDSGNVTVSLRTSRDKGNTWTNWRSVTVSNAIRNKVEWRALGTADAPGFLCEMKTAGATEFSVSGAYFNEFVQGRGRA